MTDIITNLSNKLESKLKSADEIWVAVALLSSQGLSFIHENLQTSCKQNFLVGIDLPTGPQALLKLFSLRLIKGVNTKIYSQKECYHPKVYLIREKDKFIAFIGSANCTNGGLRNNIELTFEVNNQDSCKEILAWFSLLYKKSIELTKPFLDNYAKDYNKRKNKNKEDEKLVKKQKKKLIQEFKITLSRRKEFIRVLKAYRKRADYKKINKERKEVVEEIKKTIDYPNFENIDVDNFFSIQQLGHIIAIPKPTIKREIGRFKNLLQMLCDEKVDVNLRVDRALNGNLKIRGVNIGLISKILVIHKPDLYFVKNEKIDKALIKYGIHFPRGLSEGRKYEISCQFLKQVCHETNIENFAILDYYLYLEGGG